MDGDGRTALLEIYDALNAEDIERFGALLSSDEDLPVMIGTGSREWLAGRKAILGALVQQFRDLPGIRFEPGEMLWHEDGNVGWVAERPAIVVPGEGRIEARHTAVLRREEGGWRLVSSHLSVATPDDGAEDDRPASS